MEFEKLENFSAVLSSVLRTVTFFDPLNISYHVSEWMIENLVFPIYALFYLYFFGVNRLRYVILSAIFFSVLSFRSYRVNMF